MGMGVEGNGNKPLGMGLKDIPVHLYMTTASSIYTTHALVILWSDTGINMTS